MTQETIAAALAKAQAEMGPALKESTNPAFRSKYADLGNVMAACLPALNKHGIAVIQPFHSDELGGRFIKTVLLHASGETLECAVPLLLSKNDMQGLGSAITYARRYGLMAMAGIAPEDDDGNAAVAKPNVQQEAIGSTWKDAVLDSLPPNANPRMKAEAFAKAICDDFKSVNGMKALDNRWARHESITIRLQGDYPDLWGSVVDAYENKKNALTEKVAAE